MTGRRTRFSTQRSDLGTEIEESTSLFFLGAKLGDDDFFVLNTESECLEKIGRSFPRK